MSTVGTGEGERQPVCLDLPFPQQVASECLFSTKMLCDSVYFTV